MDAQEFGRLVDLFPVVRPRNYHIEMDPSRRLTSPSFPDPIELDPSEQSTHLSPPAASWQKAECKGGKKEISNQAIDAQDVFWEKLKLAVEKKEACWPFFEQARINIERFYLVGAAEAKRFCKAFQEVHRKLVYEELSLDAARSFINSSKSSRQ